MVRVATQNGFSSEIDIAGYLIENSINHPSREAQQPVNALHTVVPATYYWNRTPDPRELWRIQPPARTYSTDATSASGLGANTRSIDPFRTLHGMILDGGYGERMQKLARLAVTPPPNDSRLLVEQLKDQDRYDLALKALCEEEAEKAGMTLEKWEAGKAQK